MPVLKDGDFVLTESVAMLRYLAREKQVNQELFIFFNSPGPLIPCNRRSGDATPSIA